MLPAIVLLLVLFLVNGVFAMAELAMMTSRHSRLQQAAVGGSKGAAAALSLSREPTRFLSTVQVGITLVGILAGAFGEKALSSKLQVFIAEAEPLSPYSGPISTVLIVLVITYLSLVLGELVPKRIALAFPEQIAGLIARPLSALSVLTAVPVKLLTISTEGVLTLLRVPASTRDDVSEEDVKSLMARAAGTGVFTPHEHELFQRTVRIGDLTAADLMVPRGEIVWLDETMPADEVRVLVGTSPFSHYPVCRGSIDQLVGVVHIKDLIAYGLLSGAAFRVSAVAHKPLFVPETCPALQLLDQFKRTKVHVAIVVDEYGGTHGLVTLNDVVRVLVGDLSRKGEDPPPVATRRPDGSLLIDGRLPLHELEVTLTLTIAESGDATDARTAAGLVLDLLGHIPHKGESVEWRGWILEVVDMDGTRIDQILARRAAEQDA